MISGNRGRSRRLKLFYKQEVGDTRSLFLGRLHRVLLDFNAVMLSVVPRKELGGATLSAQGCPLLLLWLTAKPMLFLLFNFLL